MSTKYTGGFITKSPVAPTTSAASGIWTLDQQQQYQKAGTWPSPPPPIYIEDVFSTWLYTGTGASRTITNNIDLSTKGGMVWIKARSSPYGGQVYDTVRGAGLRIGTYGSFAQQAFTTDGLNAFTSSGFSLGSDSTNIGVNLSGTTFASWTFQEQAKFFDIVTYTGNGAASRNIAHNLGSTPGCIINKALSISESWGVYHRSTGANGLYLNATNSAGVTLVPTGHTSTTFEVADGYGLNNASGVTYVAYLFAHDAGGFPASGTGSENGISCGSYTGNGSATGPTISLGYEPQWVLVKRTDSASSWSLSDNMRGQPVDGATAIVFANSSDAESSATTAVSPTATGFQVNTSGATYNASGGTYIYIAIRRALMKVPTLGTSVFTPVVVSAPTGNQVVTTNFPVDMTWSNAKSETSYGTIDIDRLRSNSTANNRLFQTQVANAESVNTWGGISFQSNTTIIDSVWSFLAGGTSTPVIYWNFRRAPGFFDEVCYTGTGTAGQTYSHNLNVVPEMMIAKIRNDSDNWQVYHKDLGATKYINLNTTSAAQTSTDRWNNTTPTNSVFTVGNGFGVNYSSAYNYVIYLFATCPGVSKVGSYTGTGGTQTINCGFAAGSRFIMIKRTDSTGDWYVWDSARGIVSGSDPYLLLNSTAAEVTITDYVDTANVGFEITSTAPAGINANGGTYIFLAIA
jgi:hypothetical protein